MVISKFDDICFPRGLIQPQTGFRFSQDSLMLSCFAGKLKGRVLDLGTGCGVIGLGLLLRNAEGQVLGVDMDPSMLQAARQNIQNLQFEQRFKLLRTDVSLLERILPSGYFDLVVCNPPYRSLHTGRISPYSSKNSARFEQSATLTSFIQAAAYTLKNKGRCCFLFLAERLDQLLSKMLSHKLTPKKILPLASRQGKRPKLVLVEAIKNGGKGLELLFPLILYKPQSGEISQQALDFCPFLQCNAKRDGSK